MILPLDTNYCSKMATPEIVDNPVKTKIKVWKHLDLQTKQAKYNMQTLLLKIA